MNVRAGRQERRWLRRLLVISVYRALVGKMVKRSIARRNYYADSTYRHHHLAELPLSWVEARALGSSGRLSRLAEGIILNLTADPC